MLFVSTSLRQKTLLQYEQYGPVAQLVEQRIENPRVSGSIPLQATIYFMLESLLCACWTTSQHGGSIFRYL